jgi:transketolase
MKNDTSNVYVLCGDGELQEGQVWEAAMFIAHKKLNKLIAFVDWNGQQIDGSNDDVISLGDLVGKWKTFGWEVQVVDNGNDIIEIKSAIEIAKNNVEPNKPKMILLKTSMGKGVDFMEGTHHWHGIAPNDDQLALALTQLTPHLTDY